MVAPLPFVLFTTPMKFHSAENHCVETGGHLASIHSPAENAAVKELCNRADCWFGLNDNKKEGVWVWNDGTLYNALEYSTEGYPWSPGEPNGKAEEKTDAAYMYANGLWDDTDVELEKAFVCRLSSDTLASQSGSAGSGGRDFGFVVLGSFLTLLVLFAGRAYYMWRRNELQQWLDSFRPTSGRFSQTQNTRTSTLASADQSSTGSYTGPLQAPMIAPAGV